MTAITRVLNELVEARSRGVTFKSFGRGFRLAARIKDLRDAGNDIRTYTVDTVNADGEPVRYARYVLVKKKET